MGCIDLVEVGSKSVDAQLHKPRHALDTDVVPPIN